MNRYRVTCYDRSRHEDIHFVVDAPTAADAWFIADKRAALGTDADGKRIVGEPKDIEVVQSPPRPSYVITCSGHESSLFDRIFGRW